MAGIYGVLVKRKDKIIENLYNKFYNFDKRITSFNEVTYNNLIFGRSVLNKFNSDRFFYENDDLIICFEGINYSDVKTPKHFVLNYNKKGIDFIKELKGVFSGFIFNKKEEKVVVFNDQLSTKSIFYFYDKQIGFIFSSEMHVISKVLRELKIPKNINKDAIYSLALYGQLFGGDTPLQEISKLPYASIITYSYKSNELEEIKYFQLKKEMKETSLNAAINDIDDLMENAVNIEWAKDVDNSYDKHISLISGGMDAKVNALLATEMGYKNIQSYTYGEPSSSDVLIAQEIAQKHFQSHLSANYGKGDYLFNNIFENYITPSDGLVLFTPVATMLHSLNKVNFSSYGLLHSGQIGDVVFGSFVRPSFDIEANKDKIGLTGFVKQKALIKKISNLDVNIGKYYGSDFEIFSYEQRQMNGTLTGDRVASNLVDHISPFYDISLINYMLNLPNSLKVNQKIYFKWLEKRHPEILNHKWEKIGMRPNSVIKRKYGGVYKKYTNGAKKMFALNYDSMNPISTWIKKNPQILIELDYIYHKEISKLEDKELKSDLEKIYNDDIFEYRNRFTVITVLLSLKLHFYN